MNSNLTAHPSDYGLPYDEWWEGQEDAIKDTIKALDTPDNKVVMLIADTGTGKTGIATAISKKYPVSTVLAPTISLEEQYGDLTGLEVGRGRRWHACDFGSNALKCFTDGRCSGMCDYKIHIQTIRGQRFRILNYAQFYALNQRQSGFASDLVICDEGQGVEGSLQSFAELWYGEDTPTWGSEYKKLLFDFGKKFLFMSASMIPALVADTMGIDKYEVVEAKNNFSSDSNPVFVTPVGYITYKTPHLDRIVRAIDQQLDKTPKLSGVIHTSSKAQTANILERVKQPERFIWPDGSVRAKMFQYFKDHPNEGLVLISPGAYEGQDFPGDMCRWQIICKVPYADLSSSHVAARRKERPDVFQLEALQRVQQACGRGMRSPDDWCVNYILDMSVVKLYEKYNHLLSQRFRDSWKGIK
jgi:Rad3-related DNA helicase